MKSSIHLFYGIIIGILVMFCVGQRQADKNDALLGSGKTYVLGGFKEEAILPYLGDKGIHWQVNKLKQQGYTILDFEIHDGVFWTHVGK